MWFSYLISYMKLFTCYSIAYLSVASWTSNNWLMIWFMMEVALIMFLGLMTLGSSYSVTETMIKYFIVQVFFSLLFMVFMVFYMFNVSLASHSVILVFLMIKLGMFPFHSWLIMILGKLNWLGFFMMSSFMKLIPVIMVYLMFSVVNFYLVVLGSLIVGSLSGVNNTSIQKMLGYSSMVNLCWIFYSLGVSIPVFIFYLGGYFVMMSWICFLLKGLNIFHTSQFKLLSNSLLVKVVVFLYGLSIAGFPPFLGFMTKWLVVGSIGFTSMKFLISLMVLFSVISTYFYLQAFFFIMVIYSNWSKWYGAVTPSIGGASLVLLGSYVFIFMIY